MHLHDCFIMLWTTREIRLKVVIVKSYMCSVRVYMDLWSGRGKEIVSENGQRSRGGQGEVSGYVG